MGSRPSHHVLPRKSTSPLIHHHSARSKPHRLSDSSLHDLKGSAPPNVAPTDFLKHSLDRAFWRLDQETLDRMIAAGKSPHVQSNAVRLTQHNGLMTDRERNRLRRGGRPSDPQSLQTHDQRGQHQMVTVHRTSSVHPITDYIPSNGQLLRTPQHAEAATLDRNGHRKYGGLFPASSMTQSTLYTPHCTFTALRERVDSLLF